MRKLFLGTISVLVLIFLVPFFSYAQQFHGKAQGPSITGKISGYVVDAKTGFPVEFSTISLSRGSKIINGTITDAKGYFKLENVTPGNYNLAVSFIGFEKTVLDSVSTTPEKPDNALGKVYLKPSSVQLKDVVIESEAAILESKIDRIVYNAEKDITSQSGDASEVLGKVPMVSVDMDGNVQLRGSSNVRILINGKPSGMMSGSIADALKSIPADQIKSIEVITSPSAKYDAEGTAGIINIITKKSNVEGLTGNINASAGTRRNGLNGNLNVRKGRFGVNSGFHGHYSIPRNGSTEFYREDYFDNYTRTLTQSGAFKSLRQGYNANLGADYDFNAYNSISSSLKAGIFGMDSDNDVAVILIDPSVSSVKNYKRISSNPTRRNSLDFNADYKRTFANSKKEFFASVLFNGNVNKNNYTLQQTGNSTFLNLTEQSFNNGLNNELTGQIDYSHPIGDSILFELGAKSILRDINSKYHYEQLDTLMNSFLTDYFRSDTFQFYQNVHASYAQVGFKFKEKYEFKTGLRFEFTDNSGMIQSNYHNLIPSLSFSRTFMQFSSVKANYSQRIQRPGLQYINPFVNASDPKNISFGNPDLTPELTHNFELSAAAFTKKTSLTISIYDRYTDNTIQSYFGVDSSGTTYSTFYNIGTSNSVGINLFGQLTLFTKFVARGSVNAYFTNQEGRINNQLLKNSGFQYNTHLNLSYDFGNGFFAESFLRFNSPRVTLQGIVPSFSMTNFGVKKEFWEKKGSVGLVIYNPVSGNFKFITELKGSNFYQSNSNIVPFRAVGASFSYRFGKLETRSSKRTKKAVKNDDVKGEEGADF